MNADSLPLPRSGVIHARYIDDMRECVAYDIHKDAFIGRFDTMINDVKRTIFAKPFMISHINSMRAEDDRDAQGRTKEEWIAQEREIAKGVFEAEERV